MNGAETVIDIKVPTEHPECTHDHVLSIRRVADLHLSPRSSPELSIATSVMKVFLMPCQLALGIGAVLMHTPPGARYAGEYVNNEGSMIKGLFLEENKVSSNVGVHSLR